MTRPYITNLIIDFNIKDTTSQVEIGDFVEVDPITGNPLTENPITGNPVTAQTLYRVGVHIEGMPSILQELGSNPNVLQVRGKIVETWNNKEQKWENNKILPESLLRYQSEATAKYIDPESGFQQVCYFTLSPDIDKRRPRVARRISQRLGSNIKGTLRF